MEVAEELEDNAGIRGRAARSGADVPSDAATSIGALALVGGFHGEEWRIGVIAGR